MRERTRRKFTVRAHGRQLVLAKGPIESLEHVLMKACLWALYLPDYPDIKVEHPIGDRYKPDLVALDDQGTPIFWAEAGAVHPRKIRSLAKRFPNAHLVLIKLTTRLAPHLAVARRALDGVKRAAPIEMLGIDEDVAHTAVLAGDEISLGFDDVVRETLL